jgi:hypothetical protein
MCPQFSFIVSQLLLLVEFNPLKAELNPICYLLALLGAHHFLHVNRIRVNLDAHFCCALFQVHF